MAYVPSIADGGDYEARRKNLRKTKRGKIILSFKNKQKWEIN